jgi:hypothetical protein
MKNLNVKQRVKTVILFAIVAFGSVSVKAQVTIGSANLTPIQGALLELKTKEASTGIINVTDAGNTTVDGTDGGGLGLPRVKLVRRTTLEPFILTNDPEWTSNSTTKIKERNAGLTVYNLTEDDKEGLHQGINVWDGAKWSLMGGKRFFYMPAFNIGITGTGGPFYCNLYDEYKRQFNSATAGSQFISSNSALTEISSLESGHLYGPEELDYVIIYYDNTVMAPTAPTINADGLMTYYIDNLNFTENTFINIVLVVK